MTTPNIASRSGRKRKKEKEIELKKKLPNEKKRTLTYFLNLKKLTYCHFL